MTKVFIDGSAGTTGLRIADRLANRQDIELIKLPEELRKDISARKAAINSADIVFLCLPDAAAVEAVSLVENENVKIIDTSTAHRTDDAWAYGFAELSHKHRQAIQASKRIANPGCHASGFIASVYPLVSAGIERRNDDAERPMRFHLSMHHLRLLLYSARHEVCEGRSRTLHTARQSPQGIGSASRTPYYPT